MEKLKELVAIVQFALSLRADLMALIKSIELEASEGNGIKAGAYKSGLVVGFITASLELATDQLKGIIPVENVAKFAAKVTETIVTFYNGIGVFKKAQ